MTPEPNLFKVEQNPIPQEWKEAAINPSIWGEGTYGCEITSRDGKKFYGYLESPLSTIVIPIFFGKEIPDRALHLYSDLIQAHITFDHVRKNMTNLNLRSLKVKKYEEIINKLGLVLGTQETQGEIVQSSFSDEHFHSGHVSMIHIHCDDRNIFDKTQFKELVKRLEKVLSWKINPLKITDLETLVKKQEE